jgi:hypothetical protein
MSDERLRELERRWKETGSVDDEAKYLAERVRVGDLEKEMLELAAYCGHQGARLALGPSASQASPPPTREWVSGLRNFSKVASVVGLIHLAQGRMAAWTSFRPEDHAPKRALDRAVEWARTGSSESAAELALLADEARAAAAGLIHLADRNQMGERSRERERVRREAAAALEAGSLAADAARAAAASDSRRASGFLLGATRSETEIRDLQRALVAWSLNRRTAAH